MKLLDYLGIIAGVLIIPQIAKITFGIEVSDSTVKVILLFLIFYGLIELLKGSKKKIENYLKNQIKYTVKKEIKNVKKRKK